MRDPLGLGRLLYGMPQQVAPGVLMAAGAHWMTLIPDSHGDCVISSFCKNPLHPGPCKGWKKSLGKHAPGALNAIEKAHKEKVAAKRVARNEAKSAASKALTGRQLESPLHAKKATIKAANKILGDDEAKAAKKADRVILNKTEIKKYSKIKAAQMNSMRAKHGLEEDTGLEDRIADALAKDNVEGKDNNYRSVIAVSGDSLGAQLAQKKCKKGDGDCDGKPYEELRDELSGAAAVALATGDDEQLDKTLKDYDDGGFKPAKVAADKKAAADAKAAEEKAAQDKAAADKAAQDKITAEAEAAKAGVDKKAAEDKKAADKKAKAIEALPAGATLYEGEGISLVAKSKAGKWMSWTGNGWSMLGPSSSDLMKGKVKKGELTPAGGAPAAKVAKKAGAEPQTGTAAQAEKGKDFGLGLMAQAKGNKTLGTKAAQADFEAKLKKALDEGDDNGVIPAGAEVIASTLVTQANNGNMAQPYLHLTPSETTKFKELLKGEIEDGLKGGDGPFPVVETFKKAVKAKYDKDFAASAEAKAEMDAHIKNAAAAKLGLDPNLSTNAIAAHILFDPDKNMADGQAKARLQVLEGMTPEEFNALPDGHKKAAADWLQGRAEHFEEIGGDNGQLEMEHAISLQTKFGLPEHKPAGGSDAADLPGLGTLPTAKEAFGPDGNVFHDQAVAIVDAMTKEEWDGLSKEEKDSAFDNITDALSAGEPGSNPAMTKLAQFMADDDAANAPAEPDVLQEMLDAVPMTPAAPAMPAAPVMSPTTKSAVDYATGAKSGTMTKKFEAYQQLEEDEFAALPPDVQQLILADLKAAKSKFVNPAKKQQVQANLDVLTPLAGGGAGAGGAVDTTNPATKSVADKIHEAADWGSKFLGLVDTPGASTGTTDEKYGALLALLQSGSDKGQYDKIAEQLGEFWAGDALKKLNAMHTDPFGNAFLLPEDIDAMKPALAADITKKLKGDAGPTPVLNAWTKANSLGALDDAEAFMNAAHPGGGADAGTFGAPSSPADIAQAKTAAEMLWFEAAGPGSGVKATGAPSVAEMADELAKAGSVGAFQEVQANKLATAVVKTVTAKAGVNMLGSDLNESLKVADAITAEFLQTMQSGKSIVPDGGIVEQLHKIGDEVKEAGDKLAAQQGWGSDSEALKNFKKALMASKMDEIAAKLAPATPAPAAAPSPAAPSVSAPSAPNAPSATNITVGTGTDISGIPNDTQKQMWDDLKGMPSGKYLSDPKDDTYTNLLALAAAHGTADKPLSVLQVLKSLDAAGSKANGWTNINKWENEFVAWLQTPAGSAFAKANPTADPKLVKKITGDYGPYEGITTDLVELNKKVPLLDGPGAFDPGKPSSDFKVMTPASAAQMRKKMLASNGGEYSDAEQAGIWIYTSNQYSQMNDWLRGETNTISDKHRKAIQQTQAAMRPVTEDLIVHRGTGFDALPEGFQSEQGAKKLIGQTIMDEAFMSTSVGGGAAFGGAMLLELEVPKGTMAAYVDGKNKNGQKISTYPGEREMLLAAGQSYQIISVTKNGYQTVVRARIVTGNAPAAA